VTQLLKEIGTRLVPVVSIGRPLDEDTNDILTDNDVGSDRFWYEIRRSDAVEAHLPLSLGLHAGQDRVIC
jgi:hypothetical protein